VNPGKKTVAAGFMHQSAIRLGLMAGLALALLVIMAPASNAQPQKPPIEVPFEFVHNQVVIDVKIDGKGPFKMLLDTNTDPSAIDLEAAKELGLAVGQKEYQTTGGGTDENVSHLTTLNLVEVGNISAKQVTAAALDLSKLAKQMGGPVRGVLGYSFLKDRIVQIDYANLKVRFFAESPYPRIQMAPNTVNTIAMNFRREDGDVIIDSVFVNNEKMRAALDTGSSGNFTIMPEAAALLGLDDDATDGETETSVGYNGEYQGKKTVLKSLRIGRYSAEGVQAAVLLPKTGHDNKKYQVNIGNDFFQNFVMTFDFKNKIVVFERVD
jgi:predicted aspartyl protease